MKSRDLIVRFSGLAGDGVVSVGRVLAEGCAAMGLDLMVNDHFGAEIRGLGKSSTTVRFSSLTVRSMGDGLDALVAISAPEQCANDIGELRRGGLMIGDQDGSEASARAPAADGLPAGAARVTVPLTTLASQATGTHTGRNFVSLGALCHLFTLPPDSFSERIRVLFRRKGDRVVEANIKAFRLGYEYAVQHYPPRVELEIRERDLTRKIINGNTALARGALDCGLHFFAGYPITPATPIMEVFARELPKMGGWMYQAEDEIAALGAVLGASFTGKRAMTATAGPGLSLMSEMIGMAVMSEIPAVIVDVQRGGPATGLPTKVEQGDLNIALYGGAGDCPRVVMAPSTCRECYTGIQLAFDLAEKYQTPVIFLSDLFIGQRTVTTHIEEHFDRDRCLRKNLPEEDGADYRRFRATPDGVSPWQIPGERDVFFTITGLEHSELGNPNYEADVHRVMTEKRFRKFEAMLEDIPPPDLYGDPDAEIGFVAWGSPVGSVMEAIDLAREQGYKAKLISSLMIYPQREEPFRRYFESCRHIIIPEMNYQGQYAAVLKARYGIRPIEMHLPGVEPVSPSEIADKIIEVHHETADETAGVGRG